MTFLIERLVPDPFSYNSLDIFNLGENAKYYSEVNFATNPLDISSIRPHVAPREPRLSSVQKPQAWMWYWYADEEMLHSSFENDMLISLIKRYLNFLANLSCLEILIAIRSGSQVLSIPISAEDFKEPVKESAECLLEIENCLKVIAQSERPVHETAVAVANYFRLKQAKHSGVHPHSYESAALEKLAELGKSSSTGSDYCKLYHKLKSSLEEIAQDDHELRMKILFAVMRSAGRILLPLSESARAEDFKQLYLTVSDSKSEYNFEARFYECVESLEDLLPFIARSFQKLHKNSDRGYMLEDILVGHRGESELSTVDYVESLYTKSFQKVGPNPSLLNQGTLETALGLSYSDFRAKTAKHGATKSWEELVGVVTILDIFGSYLPPAMIDLISEIQPSDSWVPSFALFRFMASHKKNTKILTCISKRVGIPKIRYIETWGKNPIPPIYIISSASICLWGIRKQLVWGLANEEDLPESKLRCPLGDYQNFMPRESSTCPHLPSFRELICCA